MIEAISSAQNPLLKSVRRAVAKASLTEDGYILAEGFHLLEEAEASGCEIAAVIASESMRDDPRLARTDFRSVPDAVFRTLTTTETPQGVIALVRPPRWNLDDLFRGAQALVVILDGIQDPGNAGAVLRAAEAFGATGVAFAQGSVSPYNPKCVRGSAGSVFRMPLAIHAEREPLAAAIEAHGAAMFAMMPRAKTQVSDVDLTCPCAIVLGGEARGVDPEWTRRATAVRIPTSRVESLNAAVAAGVVLYEAQRQRIIQQGTKP